MKNILNKYFLSLFILVFFTSGSSKKYADTAKSPKRELRGVWIASVANIDWPSKSGLSTFDQQQEIINILDNHQQIGLNAVFMQVRAASDAFYGMSMEPWSEWLTGVQGRAPDPYYDPLAFFIEKAHQRNLEFHAWLNLNRGTHAASKSISLNHITRNNPEWFVTYNGNKYYNLGLPEVRNYIVHLVMNIVRNYDVDGIHFDDYFYPYPVAGKKFNDADSFKKYGNKFNNVADWRRDNINQLIKSLHEAINKEKPYIKFGISPFGVWRNKSVDSRGAATQRALSSYDDLFADSRLWIENGWIDYIAPQIYWSIENNNTPYLGMVDWWSKNHGERHLYIGVASYLVGSNNRDWKSPEQIITQVKSNHLNTEVTGSIFFSSKTIMPTSSGVHESLNKLYVYPALPPTMPWKEKYPLPVPKVTELVRHQSNTKARIKWSIPANREDVVNRYVIYRFENQDYRTIDNPKHILAIVRNDGENSYIDETVKPGVEYLYTITALDRLSNESLPGKLYKLQP